MIGWWEWKSGWDLELADNLLSEVVVDAGDLPLRFGDEDLLELLRLLRLLLLGLLSFLRLLQDCLVLH